MRAISAAEDAVLTATGGQASHFRVKVKDSGGTFRDLSTYPGQNLCLDATWKEDVDSPGLEADITLKREVENISLAPLKAASPLNLGFAYPGSYAKLIELAREVQIEVAVVPDGIAPVSGDWNLAFHGYIDDIDPASGSHLVLRCSDLQARLRDTWIERERAYAFAQGANADRGCIYWRPSDTLAVGVRSVGSEANKNGHFYRVTSITTGITGSTEPLWPTGAGSTVIDGGVTWTESGSTSESAGTAIETVIQQILDDNLGVGAVTLVTIGAPSFTLLPWKQDRKNVWDAIRTLVDLIGWDIRYKWDSGSSSFKLTLYTPNRANTTADRTWTKSQRWPLTSLKTQIQWIRNACQVVYADVADRDPQGIPKRKTVVRTDATSIAAYGRRFCEISEGATLGINTASQANALADAMISDMANPMAEHVCEVQFFRHCEISDLYQWSADGLHYDSDQKLAVTGYTHRIDGTGARTMLQTRGKPSAGLRRWHGMIDSDQHALDLDNGSSLTVATFAVPGGIKATAVTGDTHKRSLQTEYEWHLSKSAGFTPNSGTLSSVGTKAEMMTAELVSGDTHYGRAIPMGHNRSRLVRGQPSAEFNFTAGYVEPVHLNPERFRGELPPNGSFEGFFQGSAFAPDQWEMQTGTWNTDIAQGPAKGGVDAVDGLRYVRWLNTSVATAFRSKWFPINGGNVHRLAWWIYRASMGNSVDFQIEWVTATKAAISTSTLTILFSTLTDVAWNFRETIFTAPATAAFARVIVKKASANTDQFHVDGMRVEDLGAPWTTIVNASMANAWVTDTPQTVQYRLFQGMFEMRGAAKSGVIGNKIVTLAAAPPQLYRVPLISGFNTGGELQVTTAGDLIPATGNNAWVSLDNVRFRVF